MSRRTGIQAYMSREKEHTSRSVFIFFFFFFFPLNDWLRVSKKQSQIRFLRSKSTDVVHIISWSFASLTFGLLAFYRSNMLVNFDTGASRQQTRAVDIARLIKASILLPCSDPDNREREVSRSVDAKHFITG